MKPKSFSALLVQNVVAGLTVSFVALTLGAAFGLLSGRGAFAGMLSAALIAFITSVLGGTRIQCSGPTGPMTAVMAVIVAIANDRIAAEMPGVSPEHFINLVILLSGAILVAMAFLRLGRFVKYVPNVVVSGFMSGIAIIIWLDQVKRVFGLNGKPALEGSMTVNVIVAVISAAMVFMLPRFLKQHMSKYAMILSPTLLTLVIMSAICNILGIDIEYVHLKATLNSWGDLKNLVISQWPTNWSWPVLWAAFPLALQLSFLAYLDTLLTSLVVDKMTRTKTKQNQELFAQGIGAAAVALIGGIPGAQATIRSVLIVKEKATWRFAGILVGIFALLEMILFQDLINRIPQAVFTGILIKVGYDVFDWTPVRLYVTEWIEQRHVMINHFFSRHDDEFIFVTNREFFMILGTTIVTVYFDLNMAVAAFTMIFYLHNQILLRKNPMRDLKPILETDSIMDEM